MGLENVLKPLQELDGYLAAVAIERGNEIVAKHNSGSYQVEMAETAKAMLNTALGSVNAAGLGKCYFMQINSELGLFCAALSAEKQSAVVVLLGAKSNVGLAKLALTKVSDAIGNQSS